jgi:hypothetical protein
MKALTVQQPWATLIAVGAKQIETRSWKTDYRGPLAIHASKNMPVQNRVLMYKSPFAEYLHKYDVKQTRMVNHIPLGCILATCDLVDIVHIPPFHTRWISKFKLYHLDMYPNEIYETGPDDKIIPIPPNDPELSFGDYTPGRYAWILDNVKIMKTPIEAKGRLGLWEVNL